MNRLLLVLLVGFLVACSDSPNPVSPPPPPPPPGTPTVSGIVTDLSSLEPLAGARVEWEDAQDEDNWRGVQTDSNGAYSLAVLKVPEIAIHVSKPGYEDQTSLITVPQDMTVNFALAPVTLAQMKR